MEIETEQTGAPEINDAEIDALLGEGSPEAEAAPAVEAAPQAPSEVEFTANGKQMKVPITDQRLKQWLSQGHDYAQRMQEANQKFADFEKQQKEFEPLRSRYSEVDSYIQQNPQWWEHVQAAYQQAQANAQGAGTQVIDPANPLSQKLTALEQKFEDLNKFKSTLETERQTYTKQVEDQQLQTEIKSIQEKFPNLNLNEVDPASGKTMEWRVMEYAESKGIKDFTAAFYAFNHDKLMTLAEERGLEKAAKNIQSRIKLGLLGKSPAPTKGIQDARNGNIKNKSYDALLDEALTEAGIG